MRNNSINVRITAVFMAFVLVMFACVARIYKINTELDADVQLQSNSYSITLSTLRGTVFDCNLSPITNRETKIIATVLPTTRAITAISTVLDGEKLDGVLEVLKNGVPATVEVEQEIECDDIICTTVYSHNSANIIASQLVGYINGENHGVSGIEAAYDELLYTDETLKIVCATSGTGELLSGIEPEILGDSTVLSSGIALTIDCDIQRVTESAMNEVSTGAAVVLEVGTGKIRAMVSCPDFDVTNVAEYLDDATSPLINRALTAYNVGSAFKPCVAAAVLEQGTYKRYTCNCTGSTDINGHTFKCHKLSGHGVMDIKSALAESCNSFFYNISQKTGAAAIYKMASSLNFGVGINLGGINSAEGSLTALNTLQNSSTSLANLSIGQGELLLSPVAILTLYEAIANGGVYNMPTIIEGTVKNGVLNKNISSAPTRVMSEDTAEILKEYLQGVIINGTGKAAKPDLCIAAGKTATAETGWQIDGKFVQHSWFCGFFPADNPKYAVAVLVENQTENDSAGAPIFKKIADNITQLENIR